MKKHPQKPLHLSRRTLRQLSTQQLLLVGGNDNTHNNASPMKVTDACYTG